MVFKNLFLSKEDSDVASMEPKDNKRYNGKIIHLAHPRPDNTGGGWGFISTPEIPYTRIFFHWTALNPRLNFLNLEKGQKVSFEILEFEDKGKRAIKIEVVE